MYEVLNNIYVTNQGLNYSVNWGRGAYKAQWQLKHPARNGARSTDRNEKDGVCTVYQNASFQKLN